MEVLKIIERNIFGKLQNYVDKKRERAIEKRSADGTESSSLLMVLGRPKRCYDGLKSEGPPYSSTICHTEKEGKLISPQEVYSTGE